MRRRRARPPDIASGALSIGRPRERRRDALA
jgi:hypothetical protein